MVKKKRQRDRSRNNTKAEMDRETCRRTYSEALRRKGGVGFGRGRGEECVSVVRQTHLLSLPGWDEKKGEKTRREVNEVYNTT